MLIKPILLQPLFCSDISRSCSRPVFVISAQQQLVGKRSTLYSELISARSAGTATATAPTITRLLAVPADAGATAATTALNSCPKANQHQSCWGCVDRRRNDVRRSACAVPAPRGRKQAVLEGSLQGSPSRLEEPRRTLGSGNQNKQQHGAR